MGPQKTREELLVYLIGTLSVQSSHIDLIDSDDDVLTIMAEQLGLFQTFPVIHRQLFTPCWWSGILRFYFGNP